MTTAHVTEILPANSTHGLAGRFPLHPLEDMERVAYATPNPCEGSLGHLRSDEAWQIADDYRRAHEGDERLREDFEDEPTLEWISGACVRDAMRCLTRWTTTPARP